MSKDPSREKLGLPGNEWAPGQFQFNPPTNNLVLVLHTHDEPSTRLFIRNITEPHYREIEVPEEGAIIRNTQVASDVPVLFFDTHKQADKGGPVTAYIPEGNGGFTEKEINDTGGYNWVGLYAVDLPDGTPVRIKLENERVCEGNSCEGIWISEILNIAPGGSEIYVVVGKDGLMPQEEYEALPEQIRDQLGEMDPDRVAGPDTPAEEISGYFVGAVDRASGSVRLLQRLPVPWA